MKVIPYHNLGSVFSPRSPSEVAKSELKLTKWRSLVKLLQAGGDTEEVLEGFKTGFHQGIPEHTLGSLRWFTPSNHESAKLARDKIQNTLAKQRRALHIFGPFTHKEVYEKMGFFR